MGDHLPRHLSAGRLVASLGPLAAAVLVLALIVAPARAAAPNDDASLCAWQIAQAEEAHDIPSQLLMAVALVESGRWDADAERIVAWPWTVYALGEGRYFETAEQAAAEVARLRAQGGRNIDVGCMQVNLAYHPDAFASLKDSFDPVRNVAYAARFLASLYETKRSWARAVAFYHSSTPQFAKPYRLKVIRMWNDERRRVAEERRLRRVEELRERKAQQAGQTAQTS